MKKFIALLAVLSIVLTLFVGASGSKIQLNASLDNAYDISDELYGLFIEDISFACDGGLVSNLVNNNSFEYPANDLSAWSVSAERYYVLDEGGLNSNDQSFLCVKVKDKAEIRNKGYHEIYDYKTWNVNNSKVAAPDMGFKAGQEYAFSAYFKNVDFNGTLKVRLEAEGNTQDYTVDIKDCADWTKKEIILKSEVTADGGLYIAAEGTGTFYMDFVNLVPTSSHGYGTEEWKYVSLRADLYQALENMSPSFIRFPGGCLAEGDSLERLYDWKSTIGPLEERTQTYNLWRDDRYARPYINTNSMGYHEYFTLCADLGATPIPILNVGLTCQGRNGYGEMFEKHKNGEINSEEWESYLDTIALRPGTPEFESYTQDIFDLIEYANGSVDTEWGAKRAANGHPEPFNMKYIGLGNENWGKVYWRNFEALYKAVKEKHPEITVVSSAGAWFEGEDFDYAWKLVNSKYPDTVVDEHYYTSGGYLFENTHRYDNYDRNGAKVFLGEYAPKSDGYGTLTTKSNIWAAVESGAYMTSIERNADIVEMVAYAPALAKLNSQSWEINMIWFDSQEAALSPDYYMQMLFSNNVGNKYIKTDGDFIDKGIYHSVTVDTDEQVVYVKVVNKDTASRTVSINLEGFENPQNPSVQYMDETFKAACNEIGEPLKVAPRQKDLKLDGSKLEYKAGGVSVSVIRIPYGNNDGSKLYELPDMGKITPYVPVAVKIAVPCVLALLVVIIVAVVIIILAVKKKKAKKRQAKPEPSKE